MSLPKLRCGFKTTVTNRLGAKLTTKWFGVSCGSYFFGVLVMENTDAK
jgi:hypothetical protein